MRMRSVTMVLEIKSIAMAIVRTAYGSGFVASSAGYAVWDLPLYILQLEIDRQLHFDMAEEEWR